MSPFNDHGRPRGTRRWDVLSGPPPLLPAALDRVAEWWAGVGPRPRLALGAAVTLAVLAVIGRGAATSPWGPERPVVVATTSLSAGHVVRQGDVAAASWPARLVPTSAPRRPAEAIGRPLALTAPTGGLLTAEHLAAAGVATQVTPGRVAFPLPLPEGIALRSGQRVDLVGSDGRHGTARLAAGTRVLDVDGAVAWLEMARDDVTRVAGALALGRIAVAVLPASPAAVTPAGQSAVEDGADQPDAQRP